MCIHTHTHTNTHTHIYLHLYTVIVKSAEGVSFVFSPPCLYDEFPTHWSHLHLRWYSETVSSRRQYTSRGVVYHCRRAILLFAHGLPR